MGYSLHGHVFLVIIESNFHIKIMSSTYNYCTVCVYVDDAGYVICIIRVNQVKLKYFNSRRKIIKDKRRRNKGL